MDRLIYGADTETVRGKPNSLQFYSEDVAVDSIVFVNEKTACAEFLKWAGSLRKQCEHVIYIHNLAFDIVELFYGHHEQFATGEYDFRIGKWRVWGCYGTPTFCRLQRDDKTTISLIDSYSFFRGSLAQGAALYCPDLPKLKRPSDLGSRRYTSKDSIFVDYAMRDAVVSYHIGKAINELHTEFDLRQCVSIANLSERVFRHKFLTYTIPQPPSDIIHAALKSYHGGKNNLNATPGWYQGVSSFDISSAYPRAMADLPAFSDADLYCDFRMTRGRTPTRVPQFGVYNVSGKVSACPWPVLFDHSFKPVHGSIENIWIQGYELNEALRSGEFKPSAIRGYYYDAERDIQAPALRAFCDDFYQRKQTEKNKVRRTGYKFILNSLSGKFIQTRKRTLSAYIDVDSDRVTTAAELVAGGMFHPFIASAITAHTRARIHRLEHHYKAIHTATDSVFTFADPVKARRTRDPDLRVGGNGLGSLEHEITGDLLLVRNKCYIIYAPDGSIESKAFAGKRIGKYALHGFQGTVNELEKMVATGRRKYTYTHANRLKESISRSLEVNDFVQRDGLLRVGPIVVKASAPSHKPRQARSKR